ncbi:MAG: hypothetical protein C0474_00075 [Sphingobium sp.]|nr:hypothetical protein [Sphingobium sp.]
MTSPCPICEAPGAVIAPEVEDYFFGFPGAWDYVGCTRASCGIAYPDPRPDGATLSAAYGSYYTHQDDGGSAGRALARLRAIGHALRAPRRTRAPGLPLLGWIAEQTGWEDGLLSVRADGIVVDIGAGDGERLELLRARGWGRVIGVEIDPVAVERGRALGRDLHAGPAEALPLTAGSADAAIMHHVIEHVGDARLALAEAARVLRAGGELLILTPNIASANRYKWGKHWRGFEAPRHLQIFTVAALADLVRAVGFEIVLARSSGRSAAWIDAVSADAAGLPRPTESLFARLLRTDRAYRKQQRAIARGDEVGDEIVVIARKEAFGEPA